VGFPLVDAAVVMGLVDVKRVRRQEGWAATASLSCLFNKW